MKKGLEAGKKLDVNSLVHLNNFIFLIFALCTDWVYDQNKCQDKQTEGFLYFVLYGNLIVYGIIFLLQTLYSLKLLESCTRKLGAVCITINTIIFVGGVLLFDLLSMIYGIHTHFYTDTSKCKELQLFSMCCAYVFLLWFSALILGQLSSWWNSFRGKEEDKNKYVGVF